MQTRNFEFFSPGLQAQDSAQEESLFFDYLHNPSIQGLSRIWQALKRPGVAESLQRFVYRNENSCTGQKMLLELMLGVNRLQTPPDTDRIQELMISLQKCNFDDKISSFMILHLAGKIFQAAASETVNQHQLGIPSPLITDEGNFWSRMQNESKQLIFKSVAEHCFLLSLENNPLQLELYPYLARLIFQKSQNNSDEQLESLGIPLVPLNYGIQALNKKIQSLLELPQSWENHTLLTNIQTESQLIEAKRKESLRQLVATLKKNKTKNKLSFDKEGCKLFGCTIENLRGMICTIEELGEITKLFLPQHAYSFINHLLTRGSTQKGLKLDAKHYSTTFTGKLIKDDKDIKALLALVENITGNPDRWHLYHRLCENEQIISPHIRKVLAQASQENRQKLLSFSKITGKEKMDTDAVLQTSAQTNPINHSLKDLLSAITNSQRENRDTLNILEIKDILIIKGYNIPILQSIIGNLHDLSLVLKHLDHASTLSVLQYIITDEGYNDDINLAGKLNLSGKMVSNAFLKKIIHKVEDIKTLLGLIHNYAGAAHRNTFLSRVAIKCSTRSKHVYTLLAENREEFVRIGTFSYEDFKGEKKKLILKTPKNSTRPKKSRVEKPAVSKPSKKPEDEKPVVLKLPEKDETADINQVTSNPVVKKLAIFELNPISQQRKHSLENLIKTMDQKRNSQKINFIQLKDIFLSEGYTLQGNRI